MQDQISYFFSTTGNTGTDDLQFFYLNADTGVITLKTRLTSTTTDSFQVNIEIWMWIASAEEVMFSALFVCVLTGVYLWTRFRSVKQLQL